MPDTFDPAPVNQDPGRQLFTNDDLRALVASYPDVFRSFLSGVEQGGVNVLGTRGDQANAGLRAGEWLGRSVGLPDWWIEAVRPYAEGAGRLVAGPTSQELQQQMEIYQPQTSFGRTAQNVGRNVMQTTAGAPILKGLKAARTDGLRASLRGRNEGTTNAISTGSADR